METTVVEVQKILITDIEKLPDQSYIVNRCTAIDGFSCLYDVLEISGDWHLILGIQKNGFVNSFLRNENQKSTVSIIHKDSLTSYKHLKYVQLLAKNKPVRHIDSKNNHNYWNGGLISVIIDDKIVCSLPNGYYTNNNHYPVMLFKNETNTYFIKTLGIEADVLSILRKHSGNGHQDDKTPALDRKIQTAMSMWSIMTDYLHVKDISREQTNELFQQFVDVKELPLTNTEGIAKTFALVKTFYEKAISTDFISALSFKYVADSCKSTVNGIKYSTVFNKLFSNITTQEAFDAKIQEISKLFIPKIRSIHYDRSSFLTEVLDTLAEAREMKKAVLKKKSTGAFNKIMDDIEFIQIDKDKYPLSHAAIMSGEIPTSTFFRKSGESYFIYNDNWDIWEEVLKEHKEVAVAIATEASKRTTYEKDIMSYFYFTLHQLPMYLERHTGKKWKGIPKLVDSANELDPPTEGSNGVAKTRSALTPIVDNEKSEVVVPYVSMKISGYQTTYCYGLNYTVLEKGFSFNGNVVTKDVEENLNGRDNYGLMFYTLTGTAQGRGYPTFLIIFENMNKETYGQNIRVHFHRTHPMRSKGGDYNPIHNWTKGCYKWMIGNVNYERIVAQQGDLAFVQIDELPFGDNTVVNAYDNHCFSQPVKFVQYEKKEKQNILGYVELLEDTMLNHTEHLDRLIPKGIYEIRQCRSWEANPKGIWSLRID